MGRDQLHATPSGPSAPRAAAEGGRQAALPRSLLAFFLPSSFFPPEYIWLNSQTLNACVIQFYRLTSNKKMTGCQFTEMGNCMAGFLRLTGPPRALSTPSTFRPVSAFRPAIPKLPSDEEFARRITQCCELTLLCYFLEHE